MTPEEINAKALELAIRRGTIQDFREKLNLLEVAADFRKFIADTSWAKDKEGKEKIEKVAKR